MKDMRFLWPLLLIFCLGAQVFAQEVKLEITGAELIKIPVAVPEFAGPKPLASQMAAVVRQDLRWHLVFNVLGEGLEARETKLFSTLGVDWLLTGKISATGERVAAAFYLQDLVKGKTVLSRGYRGSKDSARYMAHRFVDLAVKEMIGVPGVSFSRVAYVVRRGWHDTLYVQDFDGARKVAVAEGELILQPRLSPDGKLLAFVYYEKRRPQIHVIDLRTGKRFVLAKYPGLNAAPVWHPRGDRLVVTLSKDGNPDLYLIDLSGRILRRLTFGEGVNTGGSFSPDGKELAFVSDRSGSPQIYVLNLLTRGVRRLTFSGSYNVSPSWSPTGDRIAYASQQGGRFAVYTIDPHGGEPTRVTEKGSFEAPVFAPNGRLILAQGVDGLWLFLANGASARLYLPGRALFPTWRYLK